ncbi:MAG TPA: SIS domain-containing protein [Intrasporangiaceae bacterium]|nr:SIS domain-containing protein [Intrasporangiaceae bacterium]
MAGAAVINGGEQILEQSLEGALNAWVELMEPLRSADLMAQVRAAGEVIIEALARGNKLIILGNGGSAAMASHIAAEFSGKCIRDRRPLPAVSLADSATSITAIGNDYGFDQVFTRGIRALGAVGDVLIAMSTSGASENVLRALDTAREMGLITIMLTGAAAPETLVADHVLRAPVKSTPRVQEVHLLWSHVWCEAVDTAWATQD